MKLHLSGAPLGGGEVKLPSCQHYACDETEHYPYSDPDLDEKGP